MTEDFLNDSDVDALFDEQRAGGVARVVKPAWSHTGTSEDGVPLAPVVGSVNWQPFEGGEDEIVILPPPAGRESLFRLFGPVGAQQWQELRWALERQLAPALARTKVHAAATS